MQRYSSTVTPAIDYRRRTRRRALGRRLLGTPLRAAWWALRAAISAAIHVAIGVCLMTLLLLLVSAAGL